MEIACPACTKKHVGADTCTRCGCDLSVLRKIGSASLACLRQAHAAFRRQEWSEALACAERSWSLVHTGTGARLGALAAAALGDAPALARWRRRAAP